MARDVVVTANTVPFSINGKECRMMNVVAIAYFRFQCRRELDNFLGSSEGNLQRDSEEERSKKYTFSQYSGRVLLTNLPEQT